MNERIKELAELAKFSINVSNDPNSPPSWRAAGHNECFEKFAELIVKECANFISEGKFGDKGIAKKLIENFGADWSKCRTAIGINSIHNACMFREGCRKADAEVARMREDAANWKRAAEYQYLQLRIAKYGPDEKTYPVEGALDAWFGKTYALDAARKEKK